MLGILRLRVEKVMAKLSIPYQDVSDPEDGDTLAAYFAETTNSQGDRMPLVITLSRQLENIWVQGGVDLTSHATPVDEWPAEAIANFNAGLRQSPGSIFSELKMPRFRARGFEARVSWSQERRRIVSTVIIPYGEFSSAILRSSTLLAEHLCGTALTSILQSRGAIPLAGSDGSGPTQAGSGAGRSDP